MFTGENIRRLESRQFFIISGDYFTSERLHQRKEFIITRLFVAFDTCTKFTTAIKNKIHLFRVFAAIQMVTQNTGHYGHECPIINPGPHKLREFFWLAVKNSVIRGRNIPPHPVL